MPGKWCLDALRLLFLSCGHIRRRFIFIRTRKPVYVSYNADDCYISCKICNGRCTHAMFSPFKASDPHPLGNIQTCNELYHETAIYVLVLPDIALALACFRGLRVRTGSDWKSRCTRDRKETFQITEDRKGTLFAGCVWRRKVYPYKGKSFEKDMVIGHTDLNWICQVLSTQPNLSHFFSCAIWRRHILWGQAMKGSSHFEPGCWSVCILVHSPTCNKTHLCSIKCSSYLPMSGTMKRRIHVTLAEGSW